jgi:L-alanine-DL-glutamate epimerase-like enolase superfamily enzyme
MEQPVRVNDHATLRALRGRTRQPIAPNEDAYVPQNLRRMIDAGAMDAAVLDLTPAGGIAGLRQAVGIVEDAGIPAAHHCAFDLGIRTAAILHAVHGLPGFDLPPDSVYYGWADDVIADPFAFDGPRLTVPDGPGLGVTADPDAVAAHAIEN